ncbi:helix-turn-helix domain-containing protein [Streptomyces sp. LaPpAH-108]|uniref:helix-turn-helix domain-containing protein n=1 Tax=Streptomyces sp. LaPpAH-108 TaxID=1155714 RepID=UPI000362175D|nr:helix-turn-helix transcriptional regulator [Streptomyces sp. LaPpAH-108]
MPTDLTDDDAWLREERVRIGRRIREVREERGLTQQQVFLRAPLSRTYYQHVENGTKNPKLETLLRIARAIGVPLSELVG